MQPSGRIDRLSIPCCLKPQCCLQAIACAGGLALWANVAAGYEEVVRLCVSWLNHPSLAVSDSCAAVLGATAAIAKSSPVLAAVCAVRLFLQALEWPVDGCCAIMCKHKEKVITSTVSSN